MKLFQKSTLILLGALFLSGCSNSPATSQGYEPFDPDQNYTIDFLGWGGLAEQRNFQTLISEFMKDYPNVKVFYDAISDTTTYSTNLVNRANNLPDVFYVPDWDYIKWADSGKLLELSEYLSEE